MVAFPELTACIFHSRRLVAFRRRACLCERGQVRSGQVMSGKVGKVRHCETQSLRAVRITARGMACYCTLDIIMYRMDRCGLVTGRASGGCEGVCSCEIVSGRSWEGLGMRRN